MTEEEYAEFCAEYGMDVTRWEGYELLAGARELRMTTYAAQHTATDRSGEPRRSTESIASVAGRRPSRGTGPEFCSASSRAPT
ncbi:hypothetical protein OHB54_45115 [Streptomyces sp. NBC_01007]|nr:hypothetical protein OHB54_45115 [Streptomyces sp. NBC_01007]